MKKLLFALSVLYLITNSSFAQIKSNNVGNWSSPATWSTNAVPKATDDVVIDSTVTIDVKDAQCKNLSINGTLTFPNVDSCAITINGSINVNSTGKFNTYLSGNPTGVKNHTITLFGDLTVASGGQFDMRRGSNTAGVGIGAIIFAGSANSIISLSLTTYTSGTEEFNSITIDKKDGARVILKTGNLYMTNNSSTGPTIMTLKNGIVEVQGSSIWGYLATSSSNFIGGSPTSYFIGNLGRGMSNSSEALRVFPVGDSKGFRPVTVKSKATANTTGHMIIVNCTAGNANNSSKLAAGIDKVSGVRYYQVSYTKGSTGAAYLDLDTLGVSYGADDGVKAGNTNLRVAFSADARTNWSGLPQDVLPHTTAIGTEPTSIIADALATPVRLNDGASIYLALARKAGTTENALVTPTSVEKMSGVPAEFELTQNYPNPFNPSTEIRFAVPEASMVRLNVYNSLGQEVGTLVNEYKEAGTYKVTLDAKDMASGMYIYTIRAGNFIQSKKMTLIK